MYAFDEIDLVKHCTIPSTTCVDGLVVWGRRAELYSVLLEFYPIVYSYILYLLRL